MTDPGSSAIRDAVWRANHELMEAGLVTLSFGNASGLDRGRGVMLIKPSGVACDALRSEELVAVAIDDGQVVEGDLRPSSDTPTHLALYRAYPEIGGIVHTHSAAAASWAQARRSIPPFGTTHADHFHGPVPVTRQLREAEVAGDYEAATGAVIVEALAFAGLDAVEMPAVLVASHGPFTWGPDAGAAVDNAIALEAVAAMAIETLALDPDTPPLSPSLLDRHYHRKHGATAYYGQRR